MKSIELKTFYEDDNSMYPTLYDMSCNKRKRTHRVPFIAVSNNFYGCTTHYNPNLRDIQQKSFGCPRYFLDLILLLLSLMSHTPMLNGFVLPLFRSDALASWVLFLIMNG